MNARPDARDFATPQKFGIGQPVPRAEDPVLVRGEGRYTDDLALDGQAYGVFVRSPVAHGSLRGIDAEAALAMPGVLTVVTAADLDGYGTIGNGLPFKNQDGTPMRKPDHPSLSIGKVRYVGEPVALVVAETLAEARDAAEAVVLDIEDLGVVTTPDEAAAEGAPLLHDDAPGNLALDFRTGDQAATEAAFAGPLMSPPSTSSTTASSSTRWSRAPPSASTSRKRTTRKPAASPCMSARRACSACAIPSPRAC